MRGRRLSLRHSVKHYETLRFNNTRCFIVPFFDSAAKIQNNTIVTSPYGLPAVNACAVFSKSAMTVSSKGFLFSTMIAA